MDQSAVIGWLGEGDSGADNTINRIIASCSRRVFSRTHSHKWFHPKEEDGKGAEKVLNSCLIMWLHLPYSYEHFLLTSCFVHRIDTNPLFSSLFLYTIVPSWAGAPIPRVRCCNGFLFYNRGWKRCWEDDEQLLNHLAFPPTLYFIHGVEAKTPVFREGALVPSIVYTRVPSLLSKCSDPLASEATTFL